MAQQPPSAADPTLDPNSAHINISVFDLLLIELVPMAERLARDYEASLDKPSLANRTSQRPSSTSTNPSAQTSNTNTTNPPPPPPSTTTTSGPGPATVPSTTGAPTITTYDGQPETEVFKDSVYFRLDKLGFRVGQGLSERFSRDRARFTDQLDVIKFLCKDLWTVVFKKQIDNLKTNHRGVYVLTDSKFRPFSRMSMASGAEAVARAQPHLIFPCGIIRGVLSSLGIKATVQAETSELPSAIFQIKTLQAKT